MGQSPFGSRLAPRAIAFSVFVDTLQPMQTETWIGRTIIDQLTTHDRRYKHDSGGVENTTDDLVSACVKLDLITSGDEPGLRARGQFFTADADLEPEVETTLESLEER